MNPSSGGFRVRESDLSLGPSSLRLRDAADLPPSHPMNQKLLPGLALTLVLLSSTAARAAEIPMTTTRVASGVGLPIFVTAPPGDTTRLFIVDQGTGTTATIRILDFATGTVLATPYLTVAGVNHSGSNERGLLGMAFHPDYATNGYFYLYLSNASTQNQIRRYTVSANPNVADAASMQIVTTYADPFPNHNGGWIGFGPDGFLYVATGDGGSGNDPLGSGQSLTSLLGKILRLDVDGDAFPADPNTNYAIPAGNPFAGVGDPRADEIWHYGLRNPWRDSFDRLTGDMYIGDVGQNAREELDLAPAGSSALNFGWACMEGNNCSGNPGCTCFDPALTAPIHTYPLYVGGTLAITGGYVYRGTALCGMQGTYFFADYGSGTIWSTPTGGPVVITNRTAQLDPAGALAIGSISSFGEDAAGEIYICDRLGGEVFKIVPATFVDCNANAAHDFCDILGGSSQDADTDGIPDECESGYVGFCFPDVAGVRTCPCGNPQVPALSAKGCDNFIDPATVTGTGGAALSVTGTPNASVANTVVFHVTGAHNPPTNTNIHIFWKGTATVPGGLKSGFGVRCVGGTLKRIYKGAGTGTAGVGSSNAVDFPNGVQTTDAWTASELPTPGTTLYYYDAFRVLQGPTNCNTTSDRFNVSSAAALTWVP